MVPIVLWSVVVSSLTRAEPGLLGLTAPAGRAVGGEVGSPCAWVALKDALLRNVVRMGGDP
nr:hypothetical protein KitaXyl93_04870 [Kitasatospora sp. Xyl93]